MGGSDLEVGILICPMLCLLDDSSAVELKMAGCLAWQYTSFQVV